MADTSWIVDVSPYTAAVEAAVRSGRWTPQRKAAALTLIDVGWITRADACERYALSLEELAGWRRREREFGRRGLATTKLQRIGR